MHTNRARSLRQSLLTSILFILTYICCSQIVWVDLALVTVTQIVHHSFSALRDWAFVERRHSRSIDFDEKILAEFLWCQAQPHSRTQDNEKKTTMVVVIQPHWVLDEHDMDQFVNCTAVRFTSYFHLKPEKS